MTREASNVLALSFNYTEPSAQHKPLSHSIVLIRTFDFAEPLL